jgi:hypothetical protein
MTTPKKKPAAPKKPATPRKKAVANRSVVVGVLWCVVTFVIGSIGGVFVAKGIKIDAGQQDVLTDAYKADRVSQVVILRELAAQPFDGATDEGRQKAGEWFNANRFKNRADDFGLYTDAVSEAIAGNTEDKLADALEPKK